MKSIRKIAVAMSGGVDSAVSALILKKRGYDVMGVYMANWNMYDEQGHCSGEQDYLDAEKAASLIGIPLRRVSFEKEYWTQVFSQLLDGYENGITPNPDILCNKHIKFGALFDYAINTLKVDWLATGHYAKLQYSRNGVRLMKAKDLNKDQTFFLSQVREEALRKTLFPVGDILKSDVKKLAEKSGLIHFAEKKESFGICFIGNRKFKDFISEYISTPPGVMVDIDTGRRVCKHKGIHLWTLGQCIHQPSQSSAYYVCDINPASNIIYVAAGRDHPSLDCHQIFCAKPHWISGRHQKLMKTHQVLVCDVRTRHRANFTKCNIMFFGDKGKLVVDLAEPISGLVAPGQYAVFYDGNECLGSAMIVGKDKYEPRKQFQNNEICHSL